MHICFIKVKNAVCGDCGYEYTEDEKLNMIDKFATLKHEPMKKKCPKCEHKDHVYQQITGDLIMFNPDKKSKSS